VRYGSTSQSIAVPDSSDTVAAVFDRKSLEASGVDASGWERFSHRRQPRSFV
jgi:hypothetical protein